MAGDVKNIFDPADILSSMNSDSELFVTLAASKSVKIEKIISTGQSSPETGWYDQQSNEWVILLRGTAIIEFESSKEVRLGAGDYMLISAGTKHRVMYTSDEPPCIWLAVFFD